MIIVKVTGGVGNQMFQYAIGRKLSIKNNTPLLLDISVFETHPYRTYQLDQFNIQAEIATQKDIKRLVKKLPFGIRRIDWELQKRFAWYTRMFLEPMYTFYFPFVLGATKNSYLQGWWQSYKYFDDIRNILFADFSMKNPLNAQAASTLQQIKGAACSVSIHIRRSDYVNIPEVVLTPCSFYEKATAWLKETYGNITVFVFSDDLAWVKNNLSLNCPIAYVESNSPVEDLFLMSKCKHNIIANSTFSWWGAYLNQNTQNQTFVPRKWFSDPARNEKLVDLLPEKWTKF